MSNATQATQGDLGNTEIPQEEKTTNKANKNGLRAYAWVFTFNNYEATHIPQLIKYFSEYAHKWVFQEETGENGTRHLQGVVRFQTQKALSALKKVDKRIHWEKCRNWKYAIEYCSKNETRSGEIFSHGITIKKPLKDVLVEPRPWQKWILDLVEIDEPDDRTIYWIYDPHGNSGKSVLVRHLLIRNPSKILVVSGKEADIKYGIVQFLENGDSDLRTVMLDIPRTAEDYLSYGAIEQIKNGFFFSGKYEGKMVMFNPPHIIIFANFLPKVKNLSLDRWKIFQITTDQSLHNCTETIIRNKSIFIDEQNNKIE